MIRTLAAAALALWTLTDAVAADAVTLTSPGEGTKVALKLAAGSGAQQQASMVLDTTSTTKLMGRDIVVDAPPITAGLDLRASPADAGAYTLQFAYKDVVVGQGEELGTMTAKKAAEQMTGVKGTMKVAGDGRVLEQRTEGSGSDGFDLELWIPRLPAEPVGVGATWTWTSSEKDAQGFTWNESTTYKLIALDAGKATLQIATTRKTGAGTMKLEGMSVPVSSIVETGTGTSVVRVGQAFPEAGAWHLDMVTNATMVGQPTTLTTKMDVRLGAK